MANLPVIPSDAELSYNGITFNSKTKTKISSTPVYDEAERVIKYVKFSLRVSGYISPTDYFGSGSGTDQAHYTMLRLLSQPRQLLTIAKKGFIPDFTIAGDSSLNATNIDVNFGPKTRVTEWTPIGKNEGCSFVWECEFHVPMCVSGVYSTQRVMEYNYEIDTAIDERGITTRTINGHIIVPGFLTGGVVGRDLEQYKDQIRPEPIPRFKRTYDWRFSKDRMRLDFTVVDREIPSKNAYPYNITDISCRTSLAASNSKEGGLFRHWVYSFNGQASQTMDAPRNWAYRKLLDILRGRLSILRDRLFQPVPGQPLAVPVFQQVSWNSDEEIFGLNAGLQVTYVISWVLEGNPADALKRFGFFEDVGLSWQDWSVGMNLEDNSAQRPRGYAGLVYNRQSDSIIDLCSPANTAIDTAGNVEVDRGDYSIIGEPGPEMVNGYGSLIGFNNSLTLETNGGKFITVPMVPGKNQIPQDVRDDIHEVVMEGAALRVGGKWPVPDLQTIGGKRVERIGKAKIKTIQVGIANGMPIMRTAWKIRYRLVEDRTKLEDTSPPALPATGSNFDQRFNEALGRNISPGDIEDL